MRSAGSGSLQSDPGAPWGDGVQEPLPSGGVRDLLGLNIPSMAILGTCCTCSLWGPPALPRGWHLSMWFLLFCDSFQALLAITSPPELGAELWLLPGLGSLHKCGSDIVRHNNRPESYRNKANAEACCFLFSRLLDFSWMAQQLCRDKDTFPCGVCPSLLLPGACSTQEHHGWCRIEQREDGHIFTMKALW